MLDTTHNPAAILPQQVAATAYERCEAPSGSRPGYDIRLVWCVVASIPRAERTAHAELHRRGFTAYLPLCTIRWRNRTWHTTPLFTGYLFVRMRLDQPWNPVRHCPGVFSLLFSDGKPGTVAEADIRALQAGDAIRATQLPKSSQWAPGMACRLGNHVLAGHDGVISEVGPSKALVALMMFGHLRELAVSLDCLTTRDND